MMIYSLIEHTDNLKIFDHAEPVPCRPEDLPFSPETVPLLLFLGGASRELSESSIMSKLPRVSCNEDGPALLLADVGVPCVDAQDIWCGGIR
jgi:hypothetical protein